MLFVQQMKEVYEYAGKKYEEMYGVKVNLICQSYDSTHKKITTTLGLVEMQMFVM